jgi:NDP-sugar pyrophosphorylase family protein
MRVDLFDFELPPERIALRPVSPRDSARMLCVGGEGNMVDASVRDLPQRLRKGDCLIFNDTRVIPAQLTGRRGDATIGAGANIGAGTITCNYDGVAKHRTVIGEGAFIGSNSALIAPVKIGRDAIVAAGSAVSRDVADGELRMVRAEQLVKPGWADRFHDAMRKKKAEKK